MESKALTRAPEVGTVTEHQDHAAGEVVLMKERWGSSLKMDEQGWLALRALALSLGMNPIMDLDMLGDQPYDKADWWKGLLAAHPDVESIDGPHRITFGSPEWDEYITISDPEVVAVAYLCRVKLRSRPVPVVGAQYVRKRDPILWSYDFDSSRHFGKAADAKEKAQAYAGEQGKVWYVKQADAKPWKPEGWHGAPGVIADDWEGLAAKKCQTTVMRRVGKMAVPKEHGRVLATMNKMQRVIRAAQDEGAGAIAPAPDDPFSEPPEVDAHAEVGGDTIGSDKVNEAAVRALMANATRKGLRVKDVKVIMLKVAGRPETDEVSLTDLTYDWLEKVLSVVDDLDEPDHEIRVNGGPPTNEPEPAPTGSDAPIDLFPGGDPVDR